MSCDIENLKKLNRLYDDEIGLIRGKTNQEIHTRLKLGSDVHLTSGSLEYAIALLDTGEAQSIERSKKIINTMLKLQDTDENSKTFGIWSWYYEESLEEMNPPDWNWADFCGKNLIVIAKKHSGYLSPEMLKGIKNAVLRACFSIKRRDVQPDYTNISIMDSCVTLLAGELYQNDEYFVYGKQKFENILDYAVKTGGFTEYNSSTYTRIVIEDISQFLEYAQNEKSRITAKKIMDIAWSYVAMHYHVKTGQWTAPQSRCYSTLLSDEGDKFIKSAAASCPEKYLTYFTHPRLKMEREVFRKGTDSMPKQEAAWYITPDYTLGSFSTMDIWCQRRSVNAYWGDKKNPRYLNLRLLLDDMDFACGHVHTLQDEGNLLGIINFVSNGGTYHLHFDRINGSIKAHDLRIRFEFYTQQKNIICDDNKFYYSDEYVQVTIGILKTIFNGEDITIEATANDCGISLDVVLYSGKETTIDFEKIKQIGCAFTLSIGEEKLENAVAAVHEDVLCVETVKSGKRMKLAADIKPQTLETVYYSRKAESI